MVIEISKSRWKKARNRARSAERNGARNAEGAAPTQVPRIAALTSIAMWLSAMVLLHAAQDFKGGLQTVSRLGADGLLLAVMLAGCGLLARLVAPGLIRRRSGLPLMLSISLLALLPSAGLCYLVRHMPGSLAWAGSALPYLLPLSLAPLLTAILAPGPGGLILGIWVSTVSAVLCGRDFQVLALGLFVSAIAGHLGQHVRRRSTVFKIGLAVALSGVLAAMSALLPDLAGSGVRAIAVQLGACFVNGMAVSLAVLVAVPIFEALFKITTDITLLEHSDLGNALLQRLALEAPGTYHHSLVVANLAQAAAAEIGADSLLARVGSYYHDIGKLTKPDFFAENMTQGPNPHDDLQPSMSTLVIIAHVKEGVGLAMLHKLPGPIVDAIQQHHGTGLVSFFHHKARRQMELELAARETDVAAVRDQDFRYPGPKPASRETAIICLADSVEAASRSIDKASPGHLEDLVDEVVNAKLLDGQLDECDLTLEELGLVKRSLVFTLTAMLHGRIAYPKHEDNSGEQTAGAQDRHAQDGESLPQAGKPGVSS